MMSASAPPTAPRRLPKRRYHVILHVILLVIALVAAGTALAMVLEYRHMAAVAVPAEGRMTGAYRQVRSTGRGASTSHYPNVSFRTADGRVIVGPTIDAMALPEIQAGRVVQLRYDPADPGKIRLAEALAGGLGIAPWLLGGAGLLLAVPAVWGLVTGRPLGVRS
jgi:hypothetical protein